MEAERGSEKPGRGIGLLEVVIAFIVYLAVQISGGVALVAVFGPEAILTGGPGSQNALIAIAAVSALLAATVALLPRVRSLAAIGLQKTSGKWLALGAGVGLLGYAVNRLVVVLYILVSGDSSNPQQGLADTATSGSIVQFALLIALGGLLTPFGEELLFRGTLYTWLRRWGLVLATLVSAVVFGVFHGFNVVLPAAVVLGILNAVLYERSGSIWPAVTAHAVNNTFIFVLVRVLDATGVMN